jgi:hypothetical protein
MLFIRSSTDALGLSCSCVADAEVPGEAPDPEGLSSRTKRSFGSEGSRCHRVIWVSISGSWIEGIWRRRAVGRPALCLPARLTCGRSGIAGDCRVRGRGSGSGWVTSGIGRRYEVGH